MDNPYQITPQPSNTGRNIAIGVGAVILLLCCCAVIVVAALTMLGPTVGRTFSSINNSLENPVIPDFPTISPDDFPTIDPDNFPTIDPNTTFENPIPKGGRGDEIERASAWSFVILQGALDGCTLSNPKASDMSITVKEEPNSDGVWVEEWTVSCDSGDQKTYTVTFTPDSNGSTDVDVK